MRSVAFRGIAFLSCALLASAIQAGVISEATITHTLEVVEVTGLTDATDLAITVAESFPPDLLIEPGSEGLTGGTSSLTVDGFDVSGEAIFGVDSTLVLTATAFAERSTPGLSSANMLALADVLMKNSNSTEVATVKFKYASSYSVSVTGADDIFPFSTTGIADTYGVMSDLDGLVSPTSTLFDMGIVETFEVLISDFDGNTTLTGGIAETEFSVIVPPDYASSIDPSLPGLVLGLDANPIATASSMVPEPSSLAIWCGFGIIAVRRGRRRA